MCTGAGVRDHDLVVLRELFFPSNHERIVAVGVLLGIGVVGWIVGMISGRRVAGEVAVAEGDTSVSVFVPVTVAVCVGGSKVDVAVDGWSNWIPT